MLPAVELGIPLYIRNTFAPGKRGTRIGASCERQTMAGFTTVDGVACVTVRGSGMMGVPGVVARAAAALARVTISVRLMAQASSEQSIAFAVDSRRADEAAAVLEDAFERELRLSQVAGVDVVRPCAIIAAVARTLSSAAPGRFYGALSRAGIDLVAAAQGCDGRNISAVLLEKDARRALRAVHSAFLAHHVVALCVVGCGFVGAALLDAIRDAAARTLRRFGVKVRVAALVNADRMLLAPPDGKGVDLDAWRDALLAAKAETDFEEVQAHLEASVRPRGLMVSKGVAATPRPRAGSFADASAATSWIVRGRSRGDAAATS